MSDKRTYSLTLVENAEPSDKTILAVKTDLVTGPFGLFVEEDDAPACMRALADHWPEFKRDINLIEKDT